MEGRKFHINNRFDCNSEGLVHLHGYMDSICMNISLWKGIQVWVIFFVQVTDKTDITKPMERESYWIENQLADMAVRRGFINW